MISTSKLYKSKQFRIKFRNSVSTMKVFLAILAVVALAQAEDTVDWSTVQPAWVRLPLPAGFELPEDWSKYWEAKALEGQGRIVGGEEAEPNSIPYQVGLLLTASDGTFFCGGSLISTTNVLTAAHCLDGVTSIEVRLGAHLINQQEETQDRVTTTTFVQHAGWNSLLLQNDVGIIVLPQAVTLSDVVQVVQLPSYSDVNDNFSGELGRVTGWGRDSDNSNVISPVLRTVEVSVVTNFICNIQFLGVIQNTHICTSGSGGRGACSGDSGGPLVVRDRQVGVVSFGLALGCEIGWPSVFSRVTSFLDWIASNSNVVIQP